MTRYRLEAFWSRGRALLEDAHHTRHLLWRYRRHNSGSLCARPKAPGQRQHIYALIAELRFPEILNLLNICMFKLQ